VKAELEVIRREGGGHIDCTLAIGPPRPRGRTGDGHLGGGEGKPSRALWHTRRAPTLANRAQLQRMCSKGTAADVLWRGREAALLDGFPSPAAPARRRRGRRYSALDETRHYVGIKTTGRTPGPFRRPDWEA